MEFESAKQAAERLGVSVRAVQKWANEGRLSGAKKIGREWLIPAGITEIGKAATGNTYAHCLLPLLSGNFVPGNCPDFLSSIDDEHDKNIAAAEYFYYSGQWQKAIKISELYLDNSDLALALSANFVYVFANLSSGQLHLTQLGLENIGACVKKALAVKNNPQLQADAVLVANAVAVLLHKEADDLPSLESAMPRLSKGLKLFGAYVMAHKAYLNKEYSHALGIASICLAIKDDYFPVATLYIKLIKCVSLMSLKKVDEAKACFDEIGPALKEGFYQPYAEHHGLLQGVIESKLKASSPEHYMKIIELTKEFSKGWRTVHNLITQNTVTLHLTTTEFAVAMLFNRNWSVKEIAAHMGISPRMVKHHLSVIYEKLDVSNREELGQFLLK